MAALGAFVLAAFPTPLTVDAYSVATNSVVYTGTVTIAATPTPLVITSYGIGGTSATAPVTIPTTGQLFPPLYNK